MSLPTSRDETCSPNAPVRSALLNLIQDCIVGDKRPELPVAYVGGSFTLGSGGWLNNGGNIACNSGPAIAYHDVDLTVGDRITTIKWGYGLTGAGTIQMRLYRQKLDGSAVPELITPTAGITSDSVVAANKTNVVTYNHTIVDDYSYFLQVDASTTTIRLYGAIVRHDRL